MTSGLERYMPVRDSGVDWLEEIPIHWDVRKIKNWLRVNEVVLPEDTAPEYELDYVDIGSVGTGYLSTRPQRMRFDAAPSRARRVVKDGDTIISTVRTYLKAVWHADAPPPDLIASTGFAVLTPGSEAAPKFVSYVCQSQGFADLVTASSVGIAYPAIAETKLAAFKIAVPPLAEQSAIARFLDHADRRIQRCIRAKEKLIALLGEHKQALIQDAVTGRIDVRTGRPYPAYKDSGVGWLGKIPAHWDLGRNGRLFAERNETGFGQLPILEVSLRTGVRVRDMENGTRKQQIEDRAKYKRAVRGDIAYNMMRMWQGAVGVAPVDGLISPAYVVARPLPGVETRYYEYLFRTDAYMGQVNTISRGIVPDRNRLYWEDFKGIPSLVPPRQEQRSVATFLERQERLVGRLIEIQRGLVRGLEEHKSALISQVVTGKLDVREAAARLPAMEVPAGGEDAPSLRMSTPAQT